MAAKRSQKKNAGSKPARRAGPGKTGGSGERLQKLQELIQLMAAQDVVEVELEEAGTRWRIRRKEDRPAMAYAPPPAPMPQLSAEARQALAAPAAAEPEGEVFKSPMLGTFYRAPSPEAEPFVKPGDRVDADTTLCIIEAMKVMNEIKAEREFEILEVLVRNGEPVEYGQPMFLIRS
ncbi:MAG: acetyl-CoA carboxylase biotin carboxyl carrier protein [Planctomycetota bacterium]